MGLLDSFERGLERVVGGAFAKTFKSGVQPVEIAAALRRELDTKAAVVARDRILVPNRLTVRLAPADHERMSALGEALDDELTQLVQRHATAQRYTFPGGIRITLERDGSLSEGMLRVSSESVKGRVTWVAVLDIDGQRHRLPKGRTVIGRGSEADITVDDPGTSRKHVEIAWDGANGQVTDLGSTNGSRLNGEPVTRAVLQPDSVIEIGRTRILYRVLAQSDDAADRTTRGGAL
ncbi:FhaA domain-containing protein [Microcella sp.]|uniref:FhaA domain-containing protein n=1 Tax=Microcella sp. TaxID=1913979 RepID=UPI00391C1F95